tara:strand:+ start:1120 stop:1563 length:444 start_codon:yes stop_codon:yes gene_type:complete
MAAGLDPLKRKLAPMRSGARNLLGAGKVHQNPKAIAGAKNKPWLTVSEQSVDVPAGLSDQILRQYDPTGSGNPMGAKAPTSKAATFDTAATELDTAFLSSVAGTFAGGKEPKAMSMQRTGTDKNFEMAFQMPKRKKRRSLYDTGSTV